MASTEAELRASKKWRAKNKQRVKITQTAWRKAHLDVVHASAKTWRLAHAAVIKGYQAAYYKANKARIKARTAAYSKLHPELNIANSITWRAANVEYARTRSHKYYVENSAAIKAASDKSHLAKKERDAGRKKPKRCDVCNKLGKICFDHCHTSKKFRGWICFNCNIVLGMANDSSTILRKLAAYTEEPLVAGIRIYGALTLKRRTELVGLPPKYCKVCRKTSEKMCADHCHKKNVFRGWVCHKCNTALGHAHDDPKTLRKLADYLDNDKLKQKEERKNAKTKK